jgi:hypothetical protein
MEKYTHNGVSKRITTPARIAIVGSEALSFHPEKPAHPN